MLARRAPDSSHRLTLWHTDLTCSFFAAAQQASVAAMASTSQTAACSKTAYMLLDMLMSQPPWPSPPGKPFSAGANATSVMGAPSWSMASVVHVTCHSPLLLGAACRDHGSTAAGPMLSQAMHRLQLFGLSRGSAIPGARAAEKPPADPEAPQAVVVLVSVLLLLLLLLLLLSKRLQVNH